VTNRLVAIDERSEAIRLLFDADSSFVGVTATDTGVVNLLPVIR
jgi:hypothetical protein